MSKSVQVPQAVFYKASSSNPGKTYAVKVYQDGTFWCECKGFFKHRHCHHTAELGLTKPVQRSVQLTTAEKTERRREAAARAWKSRRSLYGPSGSKVSES